MTKTKIPYINAVDAAKLMASKIQATTSDKVKGSQDRLAKVLAAASDPKKKQALADAVKGLSALGFAIDAIAASGNYRQLDEAMKASKWSTHQRIALKANLSAVGAI